MLWTDSLWVSAIGPNYFIAGSGIEGSSYGSILWPEYKTPMSLFVAVISGTYKGQFASLAMQAFEMFWVILVGVISLIAVRLKRRLPKSSSHVIN